MNPNSIAVLFARSDSNYKAFAGVDVWDKDRDARNFTGGASVICHPPCRGWGRYRHLAKPSEGEKELALFSVDQVREWGGVLEHPAWSTLWPVAGLPMPGHRDQFGGWTLPVNQFWWGHKAEKATWLYIAGCVPAKIPNYPIRFDEPTHVIARSRNRRDKPEVTKAEREHTPPMFCRWLIDLARGCAK